MREKPRFERLDDLEPQTRELSPEEVELARGGSIIVHDCWIPSEPGSVFQSGKRLERDGTV
jgi:hypothetical protein